MTTYESDIKTISSSGEVVFNILSNLSNFNNLQNLNADAQEKLNQMLKDVEFDEDSCRFTVRSRKIWYALDREKAFL